MTDYGFIYCHLNKTNGKRYIGQTIRKNAKERWRYGKESYKCSTLFYNAIQKHGWDNFEHIVLVKAPIQELDDLEKFYINKFNTTNIKYGYNLQCGGKSHKIIAESTRKKLSEIGRRPCKEATKQKISIAQKGKHNSINTEFKKGHKSVAKKWSESSRQKLSNSRKGIKFSQSQIEKMRRRHCKPVLQYDKNMNFIAEYYSANEAARVNNIGLAHICHCCNGQLKTYKNYIWRFK